MFDRKLSLRAPRSSLLALGCALWFGLAAFVGSAHAQPSAAREGQAYEQSIREALRALHAGQWAEAQAQFSRAHELKPSARTLRGLGIAELELEQHVASYQHLSQALHDPRRPLPPPQRKQVQETLARIAELIGRYRIELTPSEATWTVDAATPRFDAEGNALLLPGAHKLVVAAPDHEPHTHELTVRGGDQTVLVVRLAKLAPVSAATEPPALAPELLATEPANAVAAPTSTARPPGSAGPRRVWPWAALGFGAAGVVLGTVLAVHGRRDSSRVEDAKDGSRWSDLQAPYDRAPVLTSVGFTFAAVGLAGVGVGLWGLLRHDAREARVALVVAPRGLQLKGTY